MQAQRDTLASAIAGLYVTFAPYRLHHPIQGCPCCTSRVDNERVRSTSLEQLTARHLERFAFKAMTTLGTVEDFKHFLPRLLELAASEGNIGSVDFEVLMGKLDLAAWKSWTPREQAAIARYLTALWTDLLAAFPSSPSPGEYLCGLGRAESDLTPYLQMWRQHRSPAAYQHLASLVDEDYAVLARKGRLANAYWDGREEQMEQVVRWLRSPQTISCLKTAFFEFKAEAFAEDLSRAADRLSALVAQ